MHGATQFHTSHHICCDCISTHGQTQRWSHRRGGSGGANRLGAACSNCGDQWLLPVRAWPHSIASTLVAQCRYSRYWIPVAAKISGPRTDAVTLLGKQLPLPKSRFPIALSLCFLPQQKRLFNTPCS